MGGRISHYCSIDADDVLPDIDTEDLIEELTSRRAMPTMTAGGQSWVRLRNAVETGDLDEAREAMADIEREARKAGLTLTMALEACSTHGWAGFKADWIARIQAAASPQRAPPTHFNRQIAIEESNRAVAEAFIKEMEAQDATERTQ